MVVAGIPEAGADACAHLGVLALKMRERLRGFNGPTGRPLEALMGIHAGPVIGGVIGYKLPRFRLFGDTVNTAARMQTHSMPGEIGLSEAAADRISDAVTREAERIASEAHRGGGTTESPTAFSPSSSPALSSADGPSGALGSSLSRPGQTDRGRFQHLTLIDRGRKEVKSKGLVHVFFLRDRWAPRPATSQTIPVQGEPLEVIGEGPHEGRRGSASTNASSWPDSIDSVNEIKPPGWSMRLDLLLGAGAPAGSPRAAEPSEAATADFSFGDTLLWGSRPSADIRRHHLYRAGVGGVGQPAASSSGLFGSTAALLWGEPVTPRLGQAPGASSSSRVDGDDAPIASPLVGRSSCSLPAVRIQRPRVSEGSPRQLPFGSGAPSETCAPRSNRIPPSFMLLAMSSSLPSLGRSPPFFPTLLFVCLFPCPPRAPAVQPEPEELRGEHHQPSGRLQLRAPRGLLPGPPRRPVGKRPPFGARPGLLLLIPPRLPPLVRLPRRRARGRIVYGSGLLREPLLPLVVPGPRRLLQGDRAGLFGRGSWSQPLRIATIL